MKQPLEPTLERFANPVVRYFAATRPAFISVSLIAGLLGLASAKESGLTIDLTLATITLIFALMAHAGANVLNDYYDALNGTDLQNTERIFPFTGGSRFIQNGVLTLAQTRNFGLTLMASVVLAGLWLISHSAPQLLYIGLAGLFIGWGYSAPPFNFVSRGWGELCVVGGMLLITVGTDLVQRKSFSTTPLAAGLSYALLTACLLYITQFTDRKADALAGKLHWVARLDVDRACWGYVLISLSAYCWVIGAVKFDILPLWTLLSLLTVPISFLAANQLFSHTHHPQQLGDGIKLTIAALLLHGVLQIFGLSHHQY
jgi:1,4-dihydroxy-2-naphthoate octaprenyltransferase